MSIVNYDDRFDLPPIDYDQSKVPQNIKERADGVREAVFGTQNKEFIAQGIELISLTAREALEAQAYDGNSLADVTLAKDGLPTLDARIRRDVNNLENKKADKAEVIQARKGEANLNARLDKEYNEVTAQLAQKANIEDIGAPTQEQVNAWLDANPEATTTVADGGITSAKIASGAVTHDKTNFIQIAPTNLFNDTDIVDNTTFATNGNEQFAETHIASRFIPVTAGEYVVGTPDITEMLTKLSRVPFYDRDKNFSTLLSTGITATQQIAVITVPDDGFIRLSTRKQFAHNLVLARVNDYDGYHEFMYTTKVRAQPPVASVGRDELIDESVSVDKTNFITLGKNLFNKTDVDLNRFYSQAPTTTTLAGYFTIKKPIELEANTTYTVNPVRQWYLLNHDGSVISSNNTGDNNATVTFTTTDSCLLYMSGSMSNLDVTQLEVGENKTSYEPYAFYFPSLSLTDEQKGNQGGTAPLVEKDISLTKAGESFILSSYLDGKQIVINTERQGRGNQLFNFLATQIDGNVVHNNSDDVAPIRTFATVGANHGYTTIIVVTMDGHGKTQADLGSVWTDGLREYTLLKIAGNDLTLGCPYTVDDGGVVSSTRTTPTSNLTHVSGATNTQSINTSSTGTGQLYPSVSKQKVRYILDSKEITEDGTYTGDKLQIVETYEILDYKDIIDWSRSHVGQSYASSDAVGVVAMSNTYTFIKGLACTTSHSLRALKPLYLGRCGFLQSISIGLSGHTTVRTMPSISVDGFNFDIGQTMTDYNTDLIINARHLKDDTVPPSYYTDWIVDSAGKRKYGFSMGYIVDKTNSKNADRLSKSPNYWDLRGTKKSYPIAVEGITLQTGDYLSFNGFRQYLVADDDLYNNVVVKDNKDTYIYTDYKQAIPYAHEPLEEEIGREINVIQTDKAELLSDIVDSQGVNYKTSGVGSAVFKA